jgi:hypothetical protein
VPPSSRLSIFSFSYFTFIEILLFADTEKEAALKLGAENVFRALFEKPYSSVGTPNKFVFNTPSLFRS